jgi:hypothetical protein
MTLNLLSFVLGFILGFWVQSSGFLRGVTGR